jgi:acyl dehydratase
MSMMYFEDFQAGQSFALGPYAFTKEAIIAFATEFDPQEFHLAEDAARRSLLGKLSASGWHTCSAMIRMATDVFIGKAAAQGSSGMDEIRWLKPVFAGDVLSGTFTITSTRKSGSKPGLGIISFTAECADQHGEAKCSIKGMFFIKTRP